jgi:DNA-binding NarL/FixJ family response regulator
MSTTTPPHLSPSHTSPSGKAEAFPAASDMPPAAPPRRARVMLVDDHAIMRQGLAALIGSQPDMQVCGEADGVREALAAVRDAAPDVAVVDIAIKGGDGLELIRELGTKAPNVRCLVLSMHDEAVYAERALRAGARGYVRKDEVAEGLMVAIRRVLAGEVHVSPRVTACAMSRGGGRAGEASPVGRLSDRELQVLRCVGRGLSTREAAEELFISVKTVETHREHLKEKLNLSGSGELLRYAIEFCRVGG